MNLITRFLNQFKEFKIPFLRFLLLIIGLALVFISQAQTGNVCETPIQISTLPYSHSDNTGLYGNDYGYDDVPPAIENPIGNGWMAQNYIAAYDVVYAYTPAQDDYVDAYLLGNGDLSALWVFTGCPFEATLGWNLFYDDEEREVKTIPVMAGVTYYFVLSSYPNNPSYAYTFELKESPEFDCPLLSNYIGYSCDDGNSTTIDDVVTEDCTCAGISIDATGVFYLPESLKCGFRGAQIRFYESGTSNQILTRNSYSSNNSYVVNVDQIPVGTFDIYFEMEGVLRTIIENYTIEVGVNAIYPSNLVGGDINDNNIINVTDFSLIASLFGASPGSEDYNALGNLNCDATINIVDFSILAANFGLEGVSYP